MYMKVGCMFVGGRWDVCMCEGFVWGVCGGVCGEGNRVLSWVVPWELSTLFLKQVSLVPGAH